MQFVEDQFQRTIVEESSLNLLQLAIQKGFAKLVRYILHEHKILTPAKEQRPCDSRFILLNQVNQEDESFTLRLAIDQIAQQRDEAIFQHLWSVQDIYSDRHLYPLIKYLVYLSNQDYIAKLLSTDMARHLFKIADPVMKQQIVDAA
mmetsp:Transcript_12759/g.12644  ORF Transcript_12759/g.12644 Transcript_12759/m.12644 type:complete len:147 (-) Transcript_12759:1077-1517(-)